MLEMTSVIFGLAIALGCSPQSGRERDDGARTDADAFRRARATPEAVALARTVINAHGGVDAWRAAKTLRYTQSLFIPGDAKAWVATETVEQTPGRRLYQDWRSHGGSLTWDGVEVWTVNWALQNPPKLMPFLNYYSLVTPWLALDDQVTLEVSGHAPIPGGDSTQFATLTITIPLDTTRPPVAGYYRLFLDPTSGRMRAMAYTVTYGPLLDAMGLPENVNAMGPITHVYDDYATVGGLLVPTKYHTVGTDGARYGDHEVVGWEIGVAFDESRMAKPADAAVDDSPFTRRAVARDGKAP
jgi:hypothetical protein